jgi:hypothetical protein
MTCLKIISYEEIVVMFNLLPNDCVVIHDYSENYGCKEKFELQQTYFQRTEVSIHVSVIYRHAILEVDGYFHVILNRV